MKKLFLFCIMVLSFTQINFAQCTNAQPTGPNTQTYCATENKLVGDLIVSTGSNIVWYSDESGGVAYDNLAKLTSGIYYADDTSGNSCSTSRLKVSVSIYGNPPRVFISITDCAIDRPTISDLFIVGLDIAWFDAETGGNELASSSLLQSETTYWAQQTENGCVSKRSPTKVFLLGPEAPTVADPIQQFCSIDKPTIANLQVQLNDVNNSVSWYETETSLTPLDPTLQLVDGTTYWASEVETLLNCESISRSKVSVVVNSTPKPTLSSNSNTQGFCENMLPTIASLVVGGTNIKWYSSLTSTTVLSTDELLKNNTSYFATQTNATTGCESSERTMVNVVLNATTAPTVSATVQTFCNANEAKVGNLDISGTNIKWYSSLISTTPLNSTEQLIDGEDYFATQTNATTGCESSERVKVNVIFKVTPAPTTSDASQIFCDVDNAYISNLNISGTNIKWYGSLTSTTVLNSTVQLIDGEDYYATQTNASTGCESLERTKVSVLLKEIPAPITNNTTQVFCSNDTPTLSDLQIIGTTIKWYNSPTSNTVLNTTLPLVNGSDYYATQTNGDSGCESIERTKISVAFKVVNAPTTNAPTQIFCETSEAYVSNLNIIGTNIKWYDSITSINTIDPSEQLIDGKDYFATQTDDITGCESVARTKIAVIFKEAAAPTTSNSAQVFCLSDAPTIADISVDGTNIKWYETATSTTPLAATTTLINEKEYFATQTNIVGCESKNRLSVTVSLTEVAMPNLALNGEKFCILKDIFILADLDVKVSKPAGTTIIWYDSFPNGNILTLDEPLVNKATYYAISQNENGCESTSSLEVTVDLEACNDDDLIIYDGFSPNGDGINDVFTLTNVGLLYPKYEISIYNRWGNIVYEGNANKPFWNGELNGNGELVPKGVYFYILDFNKNNKEPKQGRLYLSI